MSSYRRGHEPTSGPGRRQRDASPLDGAPPPASGPAAIQFSEASLSAAKWLAMLLMVLDHSNKYLFDGTVSWMYALGRLSMPLFAIVVGLNLARPGMLEHGGYRRLCIRLAVFGTLASTPFIAINDLPAGWWPLNMMFTLLVATVAAWLFDRPGTASKIFGWLVFAWGGALGEFWWPAVCLCLCVWAYQRHPTRSLLAGFFLCLAALWFINGNFWAFAVLPVMWALQRCWLWRLPRAKWFFYAFYPAHLAIFWALTLWHLPMPAG